MAGEAITLAGLVRSGLPGVIGVEATSCRRPSTVGWTTNLPSGTLTKSQPQPGSIQPGRTDSIPYRPELAIAEIQPKFASDRETVLRTGE
jgi:hypothetical protein